MGVAIAAPDLESASDRPGGGASLLPYALISPTVAVMGGVLTLPMGTLLGLSLQHYGLRELIAHQGPLGRARLPLIDPRRPAVSPGGVRAALAGAGKP